MEKIPGFKAYDIRGKVPSELNEELAYKVGKAFVKLQNAKKVVIKKYTLQITDFFWADLRKNTTKIFVGSHPNISILELIT